MLRGIQEVLLLHLPLAPARDGRGHTLEGLPVEVHVVKHRGELNAKSTAVHAKVLCPKDVSLFTYPDIPDYSGGDKVVLVYPEEGGPEEAVQAAVLNESVRVAVFVDATWTQAKQVGICLEGAKQLQ